MKKTLIWIFLFIGVVLSAQLAESLIMPRWMQIALENKPVLPQAADFHWTVRAPGLETTTIAVHQGKIEVEKLFLVRISPQNYRIRVHYDRINPKRIEDWLRQRGAVAVLNGSYYQKGLIPSTPMKSNNKWFGPEQYNSVHGALVAGDDVSILDLTGKDMKQALEHYSDAIVSYPLLLDSRGRVRAEGKAHWLANRSFAATDSEGRVIFGATEVGFFSLKRLGLFLRNLPLNLTGALNLDGGPVSSLMVQGGNYQRIMRGTWETNDSTGVADLLLQRFRWNSKWWKLPIVITAEPKS